MAHKQIPTQPPDFPGKTDSIVGSTTPFDPLSEDDVEYVWSTAVNIKEYIGKQVRDGAQAAKFIDAFPDTKKRKSGEGTDSAREWTKQSMIALQIYLVPCVDPTKVIPVDFIPSIPDIRKQFGDTICNQSIDAKFMLDDAKIAQFKGVQNKLLRMVLMKAQKVIMTRPDKTSSEDELTLNDENKVEKYSDALLRSVLEYLGVDDVEETELQLKEEETLTTKMGTASFTARPEFQILKRGGAAKFFSSPIYCWGEDKRLVLSTLKSFPDTVAQKAAESLAVASHNYIVKKPQEVFGIGVRHRYFSFWHAVFPSTYLEKIGDNPTSLGANDFVWLKLYPVSEFGLDFCHPGQREEIMRLLVGIIAYVGKGNPFAGKY